MSAGAAEFKVAEERLPEPDRCVSRLDYERLSKYKKGKILPGFDSVEALSSLTG